MCPFHRSLPTAGGKPADEVMRPWWTEEDRRHVKREKFHNKIRGETEGKRSLKPDFACPVNLQTHLGPTLSSTLSFRRPLRQAFQSYYYCVWHTPLMFFPFVSGILPLSNRFETTNQFSVWKYLRSQLLNPFSCEAKQIRARVHHSTAYPPAALVRKRNGSCASCVHTGRLGLCHSSYPHTQLGLPLTSLGCSTGDPRALCNARASPYSALRCCSLRGENTRWGAASR